MYTGSERSAVYLFRSGQFTFNDSVVAGDRSTIEVRTNYYCIGDAIFEAFRFFFERRTTV